MDEPSIQMTTDKFERTRHIRYFTNCLQSLPEQYAAADTNRLTLVHFCVQSLDILGCLPDHPNCCGQVDKEVILDTQAIINWIYGLQKIPTLTGNDECATYIGGGFKGGTYLGDIPSCTKDDIDCPQQYSIVEGEEVAQHPYDHSHLAMTYVGICTLLALGDDLSRVHKTAIRQTLSSLQKEDGSFMAISSSNNTCNNEQNEENEDDDCDLRFLYTAISIWYLLKPTDSNDIDNPIINIETATNYILSCITYEGSLGLTPCREGHGGSTFCGIASLYLMGTLDDVMNRREELKGWKDDLIRWCVSRQYPLHGTIYSNTIEHNVSTNQVAGMCGRPNKLEDTCYSYWVGGTLHLLNESHLLDGWALRDYVLSCQSTYGGFGKLVGAMPDVLHSFYSLAWLSLSVEQGCCDEEVDDTNETDKDDKDNKQTAYDTERRQQVDESLHQLSRFDCALGVCSKRIQALQKRQDR